MRRLTPTLGSRSEIKRALLALLPAALAVAAVLAGAVAGALTTQLSLEVTALMLGGLAVLLVAFSRPEWVILMVLVAGSSILDKSQVPSISLGFTFSAVEILLILLLGLVAIQSLGSRQYGYVKTPLDLPLALFFLASFLSLRNAVANLGANVDALEYQWRILFSYLIFFAVTNLVRTRRQLVALVWGMLALATLVAVMMIAQQIVGTDVVILPGRVETAGVFEGEFSGVTRILPPGQSLILVMLMPALLLLVSRRRVARADWPLLGCVIALLVAQAFTFNRSTWAGVALAVAAAFFLGNSRQRKNLILFFGILLLLAAIALPLASLYSAQIGDVAQALWLRAMSLFTGDEVKFSSSWQWRLIENQHALESIGQHPLLGIGPGNDYRPRIRLEEDLNTGYMHNTFLFILLDLGLAGFIPFVWFSALFMLRGLALWPRLRDPVFRPIAFGLALGYLPILVTGIAAAVFMDWYWTPVLGVMLGLNEVIYQLDGQGAS